MDAAFMVPGGWQTSLNAAASQRKAAYNQGVDEDYARIGDENPRLRLFGPMRLSGSAPISGPLPDPQWDAYFEALQQQGVTKLAAGASTQRTEPLRPGNHLSTSAALNGFASGAGLPMPETHAQWMTRMGRSGTGGGAAR